MNVVSALMVTRNQLGAPEGIPFGSVWLFVYAGISFSLVIFAGIMSGLTLGLMSLGLVDLEILQSSCSPSQKKQAGFSSFLFSVFYSVSCFSVNEFKYNLFGLRNYEFSIYLLIMELYIKFCLCYVLCLCMQRLYFRWFKSNTSCQ